MIFPVQAINELVQEFKLLRKDIQAIKEAVQKIEQKLTNQNEKQPTT
jgi:outer membrane murein-binding lipoprotein Lpp